ncbi:MAG: AtpZ/AtpI family protein [Pseudomonadota bacterium]
MAQLDARLQALKKIQEEDRPHVEEHYTQAQMGWRMVIELVVGLLIGFGIGFGLDRMLGTLPIFLILFTLLGLAAGIRVMLRSAQEFQKTNDAAAVAEDKGA